MREYEKKRAAAGAAFMEAGLDESQEAIQISVSGDNLNQLWERVRYFFQDKDQYGVDLTRPMKKPAKDRFLHACKGRAALGKGIKDVITLNDVIFAFSSARLSPLLSKDEFKQLFKALEVYHDEEKELVNYMKIRESTWSRDINSYRGIFPKMVSKAVFLKRNVETERQVSDGEGRRKEEGR